MQSITDHKKLNRLCFTPFLMTRRIKGLQGLNCRWFTYGGVSDVASGGASDWALGEAGVPYAFSMELRDTGR